MPGDAKDAPKTPHVLVIELRLLSGIRCPRLDTIGQGAKDAGMIDFEFGADCKVSVSQTILDS